MPEKPDPAPHTRVPVRIEAALAMALICLIAMDNVLARNLSSVSFAFTEEWSVVLMLIISLAGIFAWAGSTLGAFRLAAAGIMGVSESPWLILLLVIGLSLLAGMVLDGVSIYLITLPLLLPIAEAFDWSFAWFGVVMAVTVAIGQVTPPVAVNLMVAARIAEVPLEATSRWVGWLLLAMATALCLVVAFPELALWLPCLLGYRLS